MDGIPAEKYLILTPWPRHGRRKTFPARPTDPSADCASEFLPGRFLLGVDAATRAHVRANTGADGWKRGSAKAEGRGGGGGGGFAPRRDERTNGRMDGRTEKNPTPIFPSTAEIHGVEVDEASGGSRLIV